MTAPPLDLPTLRLRPTTATLHSPDRVGHYHILRQVGCGGMGIVYEGYDGRLKRPVAIKMIRDSGGPDAADLHARFQTEAEAVAQLHHPNIVQIFEVGHEGTRPFVALEFLPGGSLLEKTRNKPQPPREAADILRVIAVAMHHAHEHGVVHRDLKPANILFDEAGTPKVTDFGAARVTFAGAEGNVPGSAHTRVGEVIGTPQYMAPEQARGTPDSATPAIDVYALGAVLYQLLTGRPPFDGPDVFDTLRSVISTDPISPRHLQPNVPRDLETICLKCLEKHPARRYESAASLAADLGRYLAGETIRAKPATTLEKLWKKAVRRPVETGLLASLLVVATVGLAGVMVQWQAAVAARNDAERSAVAARDAEMKATQAKEVAERDRDAAATAETAAARALDQSRLALAADLWEKGEVSKAEALVAARPAPGVVRDWEWHHLRGAFNTALWEVDLLAAHGGDAGAQWVSKLAVSPDGTRVVVAARNPYTPPPGQEYRSSLYLIRLADGRVERVWRDAFRFDCFDVAWQSAVRFVTHSAEHIASVWDVADEVPIRRSPTSYPGAVRHFALSPDGRIAVWPDADGSAVVWDAMTGQSGPRLVVAGKSLHLICCDAKTVVARDEDLVVSVFDAKTGVRRFAVPDIGHKGILSPDGRVLMMGMTASIPTKGRPSYTTAWDTATGRPLWRKKTTLDGGSYFVNSPDGEHVFQYYGDARAMQVWDRATGKMGFRLRGQQGNINAADVSPDGQALATAADDGTVQLWNVHNGSPLQTIRGHRVSGVRGVGFSPDGTRLVTGGGDSRVLLWDLSRQTQSHRIITGQPLRPFAPSLFGALTFTANGQLRTADTGHGLTDFDPTTVNPIAERIIPGETQRNQWNLVDWAFTPNGTRLVGPLQDPEPLLLGRGEPDPFLAVGGSLLAATPSQRWRGSILAVWDGETGAMIRRFERCPGGVFAAAISPDGVFAAAFVNESRPDRRPMAAVFVWEVATGKLVRREDVVSPKSALAFSPDSQTLVAAIDRTSHGTSLVALNLRDGTRTDWPATPTLNLRTLTFSPDGKRLAGSCWKTRDLIVWDTATGAIQWRTTTDPFTHLAYSPDGRRLAGVNYTGTVTLWDATTGHEAYSLAGAKGRRMDYAHPARVAFSPDGKYLAANQHDGTIYVWTADRNPSAVQRRAEAEAARFAHHLRLAQEATDPAGSAFALRFHRDRLQTLTAPTEALRQEAERLRQRLARETYPPGLLMRR